MLSSASLRKRAISHRSVGIAEAARATDYESGGQEFESLRARQFSFEINHSRGRLYDQQSAPADWSRICRNLASLANAISRNWGCGGATKHKLFCKLYSLRLCRPPGAEQLIESKKVQRVQSHPGLRYSVHRLLDSNSLLAGTFVYRRVQYCRCPLSFSAAERIERHLIKHFARQPLLP
jgi:hypothetical protein